MLDCRPVFGEREFEGGAAASAGIGGGFAGGVVVEAELFSAEAGAAAAVAVGEDVAALEAFGWFGLRCLGLRLDGVMHWSLPQGVLLVQSLRKKRFKSGLPGPWLPFSRLKCEGPAFGPDLFSFYFYFIEWGETKMPD
jgi:hypothetical protein